MMDNKSYGEIIFLSHDAKEMISKMSEKELDFIAACLAVNATRIQLEIYEEMIKNNKGFPEDIHEKTT